MPKLRSIFFFLYTTTVKTSTTKAHPVGVHMVSPSTCAIPPTTVQKGAAPSAVGLVPDQVPPLLFWWFVAAAAMSCYCRCRLLLSSRLLLRESHQGYCQKHRQRRRPWSSLKKVSVEKFVSTPILKGCLEVPLVRARFRTADDAPAGRASTRAIDAQSTEL
jgi:hypothetical protein